MDIPEKCRRHHPGGGGQAGGAGPGQCRTYAANTEGYAARIEALDREFADFFAGVEDRTMVFGDRFPLRYFAEEFDIDYYAAFPGCSTQTEPSAATIAFLTDKVREEGSPRSGTLSSPIIWWRTALRRPRASRRPCSTPATMYPRTNWRRGHLRVPDGAESGDAAGESVI